MSKLNRFKGAVKGAMKSAKDKSPMIKDIAKQVRDKLFPKNFLDFCKNPSTDAINADPTILISMFNVLSFLKSPKLALFQATLYTGVAEMMKSPQAIQHLEQTKVAALSSALENSDIPIDVLPPDVLCEVVKYVSLSDIVNVMKVSGIKPSDFI